MQYATAATQFKAGTSLVVQDVVVIRFEAKELPLQLLQSIAEQQKVASWQGFEGGKGKARIN